MWSDDSDGGPYQSRWNQHCSGCSCSNQDGFQLGICSSSMWVSYLTIDDLTFIKNQNKYGFLMQVSYKRQELLALRGRLGSSPVFGGVRVAHHFSFLCCVFCFVCLRPVSCVPYIVSFSGLSILDYPFGFL